MRLNATEYDEECVDGGPVRPSVRDSEAVGQRARALLDVADATDATAATDIAPAS